jgi:hypothetical protein
VVLLPVVLAVAGAADLGTHGRHVKPVDVVFLVISGLIAVIIGLLQGRMIGWKTGTGRCGGRCRYVPCGCGRCWSDRGSS